MTQIQPIATRPNWNEADRLRERGDRIYFIGCLICGTWILGAIGAPILLYGMHLMRKAERLGATIRPWSITVIGGLILVDASVNYLAWGMDWLPSHSAAIVRSLWINYGMFGDGGYALYYNLPANPAFQLPASFNYATYSLGGVSLAAEKAVQLSFMILVMPIRAAAAWGLINMKRWGLQWSIIGNWLYLTVWAVYCPLFMITYDLRFGSSEFGILGFWLIGGIPFLGPLVLLPYLHTAKRDMWSD